LWAVTDRRVTVTMQGLALPVETLRRNVPEGAASGAPTKEYLATSWPGYAVIACTCKVP